MGFEDQISKTVKQAIVIASSIIYLLVMVFSSPALRLQLYVHHTAFLTIVFSAVFFQKPGAIISASGCVFISIVFLSMSLSEEVNLMTAVFGHGFIIQWLLFYAVGLVIGSSEVLTQFDQKQEDLRQVERERNHEVFKLKKENQNLRNNLEKADQKTLSVSSRMTSLQIATKEISASLQLDDILKAINSACQKLMKTKRHSIFIFADDSKDTLELAAYHGWEKNLAKDFKIKVSDELIGYAAVNSMVITPQEMSADYTIEALAKSSEFKFMLAAPLKSESEVYGILAIEELENSKMTNDDNLVFSILTTLCSLAINNSSLYEAIQMLANTDGLTKLFTHRYFQELMENEIERSKRYNKVCSVIMSDIDHFKKFNDDYGHQAGDYVLEQVAHLFQRTVRKTDTVARYGGEEFISILPETDVNGSFMMAERIRKSIESTVFNFEDQKFQVTVSLGVSTYPIDSEDRLTLIKLADTALYNAKETGRNRTTVYSMLNDRS